MQTTQHTKNRILSQSQNVYTGMIYTSVNLAESTAIQASG